MAAIVRQTLSRSLAKDLLIDMQSSDSYYIGIGKSDEFPVSENSETTIDPVDCPRDEREFRHNLQSIKKIEGSTFVAKRVNWSSGSIYTGWDDATPSDIVEPWTPFYVLNDAKEVYVCIDYGKNIDGSPKQSMVEPNHGYHKELLDSIDPTNTWDYTKVFETGDGYTWKFLYSITPERIYQFLSSNHFPIQETEPDYHGGDSIEDLQRDVHLAAVGGQVTRAKVITQGLGYITEPTVTVVGDGSGATATAVIDVDGKVTEIKMTDYGSGYTYASLTITDGDTENCTAVPVVTTSEGLGKNPIDDLKTSSILAGIKPDGNVNGTFITQNTFREMGLIKSPLLPDGSAPFTGTSVKALPTLTLEDTSPFVSGKLITGGTSTAKAYVDQSDGNVVHYHQNESTGFVEFKENEAVVQEGQVAGVIATGGLSPVNGIDRFSGEVLYIETRTRIRRDEEQQEDIKIVITV